MVPGAQYRVVELSNAMLLATWEKWAWVLTPQKQPITIYTCNLGEEKRQDDVGTLLNTAPSTNWR